MKSRMLFRETGGVSHYRTTSSAPAWGWGLVAGAVLLLVLTGAHGLDEAVAQDEVAAAAALAQMERRLREEMVETVAAARAQGRRDAIEELRVAPSACLQPKGGR